MTLLLMIGANMISFSFRFSRNEPTFPLCYHCETARCTQSKLLLLKHRIL